MLTIEQGKVYSFKLNSGEELIAKVEFVNGEFITISEPVSVAPGPQGMGLIPSLFTADPRSGARLNTNSVALCALTDDNVKMKYIEATTGIKLPEKKIVLG
jgi:hypothetical protein